MTDNETIAEFLGLTPDHVEHEEGIDYDWNNCPPGLHWAFDDAPPFDRSFEWLMPVWYKFKVLKFESLDDAAIHHEMCEGEIGFAILHYGCAGASKILADGIRWYNTINKTVT